MRSFVVYGAREYGLQALSNQSEQPAYVDVPQSLLSLCHVDQIRVPEHKANAEAKAEALCTNCRSRVFGCGSLDYVLANS